LKGQGGLLMRLSFSPDGKRLAVSSDRTIQLWSLPHGNLIKDFREHSDRIWDISFSPDNQKLASASADTTVRLWSKDGTALSILNHTAAVTSVSFSPDSQTIASASTDKLVRFWHQDGTLLKTLKVHQDGVQRVNFSPDGQMLTAATSDHRVILWNLNLDDLLRQGCDRLRDELKINPKLNPTHHRLCEHIGYEAN
jgi:WD40 repeat protein